MLYQLSGPKYVEVYTINSEIKAINSKYNPPAYSDRLYFVVYTFNASYCLQMLNVILYYDALQQQLNTHSLTSKHDSFSFWQITAVTDDFIH